MNKTTIIWLTAVGAAVAIYGYWKKNKGANDDAQRSSVGGQQIVPGKVTPAREQDDGRMVKPAQPVKALQVARPSSLKAVVQAGRAAK